MKKQINQQKQSWVNQQMSQPPNQQNKLTEQKTKNTQAPPPFNTNTNSKKQQLYTLPGTWCNTTHWYWHQWLLRTYFTTIYRRT